MSKQTFYYKGDYGHRRVAVKGDDTVDLFKENTNGPKPLERWVCECGSKGTFGTKSDRELRDDHAAHVERALDE